MAKQKRKPAKKRTAKQVAAQDMRNLRKKFGNKKVDQNRPDRHLDNFLKQPIAATVRKFTRRKQNK